jgi:hypothetical protein
LYSVCPNEKTKLADLALVCPNRNRVLHRGGDLLTIEKLRPRVVHHLLVLPRTALAAYETPTTVTVIPASQADHYWDLDTGTMADTPSASATDIDLNDGFVYSSGDVGIRGDFFVDEPYLAPVAYYSFVDPDTGSVTKTFDAITYADLASVSWLSDLAADVPDEDRA